MSKTGWRLPVVLAAVALAVSLWLPWVYFGSATRTSFGVFRSAQRLGFDELAPFRVGWYLLPVASIAVMLFALLEWRRRASWLLLLLAVVEGVPAFLVVVAGGAAIGANVALAASWCALVVGALTLRAGRVAGSDKA